MEEGRRGCRTQGTFGDCRYEAGAYLLEPHGFMTLHGNGEKRGDRACLSVQSAARHGIELVSESTNVRSNSIVIKSTEERTDLICFVNPADHPLRLYHTTATVETDGERHDTYDSNNGGSRWRRACVRIEASNVKLRLEEITTRTHARFRTVHLDGRKGKRCKLV